MASTRSSSQVSGETLMRAICWPSDQLRPDGFGPGLAASARRVVKELIEGMLLKHEAKRWTASA